MASFKTHCTWGVVLGVAGVIGTASLALVEGPNFFVALFLAVVIGALMPDMDSDSSIPFHVTFGSLSCVAGGLAFAHAIKTVPGDYQMIAGYVIGTVFVVWVVIGSLFKHFTHHRGMAHSIPAALLSGVVTFAGVSQYGFSEWEGFLLAVAITVGYLGHLVLDEAYAGVNWGGIPFVAKQSLGSALKFFSRDKSTNALVYGILVFLLLGNWAALSRLGESFFRMIHR